MSFQIYEYAQTSFPHPIADAILGLNRAVSSHEKRDRIIEVFRTSIRLLSAYSIGIRVQFGEGPDGASKSLSNLIESLRRRGLTDGQWVSILRELLREYKSQPELYPVQGMVELFHRKRAKFAKLTNELLDMRKSQTVAHGRVFDEDDLLEIIAERSPQLETFLEQLKPIFDQFRLCIGNGQQDETGVDILHGLGSTFGSFSNTLASEKIGLDHLCIINAENVPVVFLHPTTLFRSPLSELPKEIFVFEKRGKKGARLLSLPNMYEIESEESWEPIEAAFFSGERYNSVPEIEGVDRPFRGLSAFESKHAPLFFGRNQETDELTNRIRGNGFVVLTGPSGTGKSSLIQAGVVPQLSAARLLIFRPGMSPLQTLSKILQSIVPTALQEGLHTATMKGDEELVAKIVLSATAAVDKLTVLVVDQGEELVTLCPDAQIREPFGAILSELSSSSTSNMRVVYSLREDFFGPVGVVEKIRSVFSRQVMVITTPTQEDLMETLSGPARLFGYMFEDFELLQEMTEAVLNESAALALLQFCADKMWDRRDRHRKYLTRDSYYAIGGVGGALANHAEEVLQSLPPLQQNQMKYLLLRLVTEDKTKQLCSRTELLEGAHDQSAAAQLLDSLLKARLLTSRSEAQESESYYELVHEALIVHWGRLKDWLLANQEGQRTLLALRQATFDWEERGRNSALLWRGDLLEELRHFKRTSDVQLTQLESKFADACERLAQRSTRIRNALIVTAFLVVSAFSVFSYYEFTRAERQRVFAEQQQKIAEEQKELAEQQTQEALRQQGIAEQQTRLANEQKQEAILQKGIAEEQTMIAETQTQMAIRQKGIAEYQSQVADEQREVAEENLLQAHLEAKRNFVATLLGQSRLSEIQESYGISVSYLRSAMSMGLEIDEVDVVFPAIRNALFADYGYQLVVDSSADFTLFEDNRIITISGSTLSTWNPNTGELIKKFDSHYEESKSPLIGDVLFLSPTRRHFAYATPTKQIKVWDMEKDSLAFQLNPEETSFGDSSVSYSSEGQHLITLTGKDEIRKCVLKVWDALTGDLLHTIEAPKSIEFATLNDPTKYLVFSMDDDTVHIYPLSHFEEGASYSKKNRIGRFENISLVELSPKGDYLVVNLNHVLYVAQISDELSVLELEGHQYLVSEILFSADGRYMISTDNWQNSFMESANQKVYPKNSNDYTYDSNNPSKMIVWDLETGTQEYVYESEKGVSGLTLDSRGKTLYGSINLRSIGIWSMNPFELVHTLKGSDQIMSISISPDDKNIVTSSISDVRIWEPVVLSSILAKQPTPFSTINFSTDGRYYVGASTKRVLVFDAETDESIMEITELSRPIRSAVFSHNNTVLALGSDDGTVSLWSVPTGEQIQVLGSVLPLVPSTLPTREEYLKQASGWDASQVLEELFTGLEVNDKLREYTGVISVDFSPDDSMLIATYRDGMAKLWDLKTGEVVHSVLHTDRVSHSIFSPDGQFVLTGSDDKHVKVWDVKTGEVLYDIVHKTAIRDIVFANNNYFLTLSNERVKQYDIRTGKYIRSFVHGKQIKSMALTPDSKILAAAGRGHTISIWNRYPKQLIKKIYVDGEFNYFTTVALSVDGTLILAGDDEDSLYLIDVATEEILMQRTYDSSIVEMHRHPNRDSFLMTSYQGAMYDWIPYLSQDFGVDSDSNQIFLLNIPNFRVGSVLELSGRKTNHRICQDSLKAVPVIPFPKADSIWAPEDLCDE